MRRHLYMLFIVVFALCGALSAFAQGGSPWTHQAFRNDPADFRFAIIGDVTGGERGGVFDQAIEKLNLLQPEFVMSVGDLVRGYALDPKKITAQFDAFDAQVARLQMPFFRVPGNHDISNSVMQLMYTQRYGQPYTHFVYRNVLFLCVNTEDERVSTISDAQIAYFTQVLADNPEVRWTLVFMHKPLWLEKDPGNLLALEALLADRPYTVFAGHRHNYRKYHRHGREYLMLATTGGGSKLRGAREYGEFDQLVWVTMTAEGPVIALLALDGIFDSDLRTDTPPPPSPAPAGAAPL